MKQLILTIIVCLFTSNNAINTKNNEHFSYLKRKLSIKNLQKNKRQKKIDKLRKYSFITAVAEAKGHHFVGFSNGALIKISPENDKFIMNFEGNHYNGVTDIIVQNNTLISASPTEIKVWNIHYPQCIKQISDYSFIKNIAYAESTIVIGGNYPVIFLYDIATSKDKRLIGHTNHVSAVAYKNKQIISTSYDRTIRIWDMISLECKKILTCADSIHSLCLNNRSIIVGCENGTLEIWNRKKGIKLFTYNDLIHPIFKLINNNNFIIALTTNKINQLDITTKEYSELVHDTSKNTFFFQKTTKNCGSLTMGNVKVENDKTVVLHHAMTHKKDK